MWRQVSAGGEGREKAGDREKCSGRQPRSCKLSGDSNEKIGRAPLRTQLAATRNMSAKNKKGISLFPVLIDFHVLQRDCSIANR